jgi:polyhydroxybutyrate depolymerase
VFRFVRCVLSFALVVACLAPATVATAGPACSTQTTGGLVTRHVDGERYELFVPERLPRGMHVPLVLMFHGLGSSGRAFASNSGWIPFASTRPMIIAFPTARGRAWAFTHNSPDVTFTRHLVAQISGTYCVDARRVYAGGMSNGAYFAARLGCDAPDVFAAVAAFAGGDPETARNPCTPKDAIAVAQMHGSGDMVVPMSLGVKARDAWVRRSSCSTHPIFERVPYGPLAHYGWCTAGVEVMWRVYDGWKHAWPKGELQDDVLIRTWRFFYRYRR